MDEPPTLSTLVVARSACGVRLSVSVLFAGLVSLAAVTVAVLASEPVADGLTCATTVYVTLAPGAMVAMVSLSAPDWLLLPLPLQVKEVTPAGSGSLTATLVAVL